MASEATDAEDSLVPEEKLSKHQERHIIIVSDNTKITNPPTAIIYATSLYFESCAVSKSLEQSQLKPFFHCNNP